MQTNRWYLRAAFTVVLWLLACPANAQTDTLYFHTRAPQAIELIRLGPEVIEYRTPGEQVIRSVGRAAVLSVRHRSGTYEFISSRASLTPDWTDARVRVLPSHAAAEGLLKVGSGLGKTQGWITLHSGRTSHRKALRRLKYKAVNAGAEFMVVDETQTWSHAFIAQAVISATFYTYPPATIQSRRLPLAARVGSPPPGNAVDTLEFIWGEKVPVTGLRVAGKLLAFRRLDQPKEELFGTCVVRSIKYQGAESKLFFVPETLIPEAPYNFRFAEIPIASSYEEVASLKPIISERLVRFYYYAQSDKFQIDIGKYLEVQFLKQREASENNFSTIGTVLLIEHLSKPEFDQLVRTSGIKQQQFITRRGGGLMRYLRIGIYGRQVPK